MHEDLICFYTGGFSKKKLQCLPWEDLQGAFYWKSTRDGAKVYCANIRQPPLKQALQSRRGKDSGSGWNLPPSRVAVRCARKTLRHCGPLFGQLVWKLESWLA